MGTLDCKQS